MAAILLVVDNHLESANTLAAVGIPLVADIPAFPVPVEWVRVQGKIQVAGNWTVASAGAGDTVPSLNPLFINMKIAANHYFVSSHQSKSFKNS